MAAIEDHDLYWIMNSLHELGIMLEVDYWSQYNI